MQNLYIHRIHNTFQSQLFIQFIVVLSFSGLNYFRAFAFLKLTRVDIAPVPILSPFAYLDVRKGDVTRPRWEHRPGKKKQAKDKDKDEGCPVPGRRHNTRDSSGITQHAQVRGSRLNEILIKPRRRAAQGGGNEPHNGTMATKSSEGVGALLPKEQPRRDNYIEAAARNLTRKTCLRPLKGPGESPGTPLAVA